MWHADITYIPLQRRFLYLVAVMDRASRCVLASDLSKTLDSEFCVLVVEEALETHPAPEIFNTDQGSQFTAQALTGCLGGAGVRISMDGRGRCMDNVFSERLWRSLKYEAVYWQELADGFAARARISDWTTFYNTARPHGSLGYRPPTPETTIPSGWPPGSAPPVSQIDRQTFGALTFNPDQSVGAGQPHRRPHAVGCA